MTIETNIITPEMVQEFYDAKTLYKCSKNSYTVSLMHYPCDIIPFSVMVKDNGSVVRVEPTKTLRMAAIFYNCYVMEYIMQE